MQHRRLRLGDILDDYCPRERRVTNHAVVAMIGDQIKQTRCTTCDAEHAYKEAQIPKRRKKETPAALYEEILAQQEESAGGRDAAGRLNAPPMAEADSEEVPAGSMAFTGEVVEDTPSDLPTDSDGRNVEGPVHRPLIRATLPRPEGQAPARPAPDFTVRQAGGRNGSFMRGDPRGGRRAGRAHGRPGPAGGSREDIRGPRTQFQQHGGRHSADRRPFPPKSHRSGQTARPGKKRSR